MKTNLIQCPRGPGFDPHLGIFHGSFCCGQSSDNLFWTHHSLKCKSSIQNPECKTYYVNLSSGPCDIPNSNTDTDGFDIGGIPNVKVGFIAL